MSIKVQMENDEYENLVGCLVDYKQMIELVIQKIDTLETSSRQEALENYAMRLLEVDYYIATLSMIEGRELH